MNREYIASERFIHDDLLEQAEAAVRAIYDLWKKERKIMPILFTWPAERISTDSGKPHEGVCVLELPEEASARADAVLAMVRRTKAYALLLIMQEPDEVRAVFETRHGARCWSIPLVPHGDVAILEPALVEDDGRHVGLLWSPTMGRS